MTSFRDLTTMRVGGPAREYAAATTTEELLDLVRSADAGQLPVLLVGGGSNLVVGDSGWDGQVVRIASSGIDIDGEVVRADAGVDWDTLVARTVEQGLSGLEALSAIPGTVGAAPVQNVGAYGSLTSDVLRSVTVLDRTTGQVEQWGRDRCGFGSHRQSTFKHTDRYVIVDVTFALTQSSQSGPQRYAAVLDALSLPAGGTAPIADVRRAVTDVRRARGSVVDPADPDTWGVGTFFINLVEPSLPPRLAKAVGALPEGRRPTYPDPLGVKIASGWLVQNSGFRRGYGAEWGRGNVRLSSKHFGSVCNYTGDATTDEVMAFAAHIRQVVQRRWEVRLRPECHLINCSFDDAASSMSDVGPDASQEGRASSSWAPSSSNRRPTD